MEYDTKLLETFVTTDGLVEVHRFGSGSLVISAVQNGLPAEPFTVLTAADEEPLPFCLPVRSWSGGSGIKATSAPNPEVAGRGSPVREPRFTSSVSSSEKEERAHERNHTRWKSCRRPW